MTPSTSATTSTGDHGPECTSCRGSADGCRARQAARFGQCCQRCSHASRPQFLAQHRGRSTPGYRGHPPQPPPTHRARGRRHDGRVKC